MICIDLHGKLKIAMTSCPTTSADGFGFIPTRREARYHGDNLVSQTRIYSLTNAYKVARKQLPKTLLAPVVGPITKANKNIQKYKQIVVYGVICSSCRLPIQPDREKI